MPRLVLRAIITILTAILLAAVPARAQYQEESWGTAATPSGPAIVWSGVGVTYDAVRYTAPWGLPYVTDLLSCTLTFVPGKAETRTVGGYTMYLPRPECEVTVEVLERIRLRDAAGKLLATKDAVGVAITTICQNPDPRKDTATVFTLADSEQDGMSRVKTMAKGTPGAVRGERQWIFCAHMRDRRTGAWTSVTVATDTVKWALLPYTHR